MEELLKAQQFEDEDDNTAEEYLLNENNQICMYIP